MTTTLNERLPLENSSHSPQTLAKRVSNDSQHFIFRLSKMFSSGLFNDFHQFLHVFRIILKSCTFLDVSGICSMKNYTMWTKYHPCTMQKVVFHTLSKSGIFFVSFFLATGGTTTIISIMVYYRIVIIDGLISFNWRACIILHCMDISKRLRMRSARHLLCSNENM